MPMAGRTGHMLRRGNYQQRSAYSNGNKMLGRSRGQLFASEEEQVAELARKFFNWARNHNSRGRVEDLVRSLQLQIGKPSSSSASSVDPESLRPLLSDLAPSFHFHDEQLELILMCWERANQFGWGQKAHAERAIFAARCGQLLWFEEENIDQHLAAAFRETVELEGQQLTDLVLKIGQERVPLDGSEADLLTFMAETATIIDIKVALVMWLALLTLDCHRVGAGAGKVHGLSYNPSWNAKNKAWHRRTFEERLLLESHLSWGLVRLLNYLFLFLFLFWVLESAQQKMAGADIRKVLVHNFGLDRLGSIASIDELNAYLADVSNAVDVFSPLSNSYFGNDMSIRLIDGFETFASAQRREGSIGEDGLLLDLPITGSFSFSAWVQVGRRGSAAVPGENDRFIIRKREGQEGKSTGLPCWGWKANGRLVFGAHDRGRWEEGQRELDALEFPLEGFLDNHRNEEGETWGHMLPGNTQANRSSTSSDRTLVAVSVNGTSVEFFVGGGARLPAGENAPLVVSSTDFNGGVPLKLPRDITDCSSGLLAFGDNLIGIGELFYYPRSLSRSDVQMILEQGGSDWAMGNNVRPPLFIRNNIREVQVASREESAYTRQRVVAISQESMSSSIALQAGVQLSSIRGYPRPPPLIPGTNRVPDNITGLSPFSLIENPVTVLPETEGTLSRWEPSPPHTGDGSTYAGWVRHDLGHSYWIYRGLSAHSPLDMCWGAFFYADRIEMTLSKINYEGAKRTVQLWQHNWVSEQIQWSGNQWRHVAVVWDPPYSRKGFKGRPCGANERCGSHIYLDGRELNGTWFNYLAPLGDEPQIQDCPPQESESFLLLGHRPFAPLQWQWTGAVQQMKYYSGVALSADQLFQLFVQSPGSTSETTLRKEEGCRFKRELRDSADWTDQLNHDCAWYQAESLTFPSVCSDVQARLNCPVACRSTDLCNEHPDPAPSTTVWNRLMLLDPSTLPADGTGKRPSGVVCLSSDADEHLRDETLWRQLKGSGWDGSSTGLPFRVDSTCSFEASEMKKIADAYSEKQEFTVHFWIHAGALVDHDESESEVPWVRLFRQLPKEQRNMSASVDSHSGGPLGFADGDAHIHFKVKRVANWPNTYIIPVHAVQLTGPNCSYRPIQDGAEVSEIPVMKDDWLFLAISRTKDHQLIGVGNSRGAFEQHNIHTADGKGSGVDCAPGFIDAIAVNKRMLLSPITVTARAVPLGDLQALYYEEKKYLAQQAGPRISDAARLQYAQLRTTRRFTHRTMLLAPPILAQSIRKEAPCLGELEDDVLREFRRKLEATHCASGVYLCPFLEPNYRLFTCSDPITSSSFMHCDASEEKCYFGKAPNEAGDFTEFLRTMDHDYITRLGSLFTTASFINERSHSLLLSLVFHSPEYGITTLLEIGANINRPRPLAFYTVRHLYSLVREQDWHIFLVCQVLCEVLNVLLLFSTVKSARTLFARIRRRRGNMMAGDAQKIFFTVYDLFLNVLIAGLAVAQTYIIFQARPNQDEIVRSLVQIPWGEAVNDDNKGAVFQLLLKLQRNMSRLANLENLAMSVLLVLLIRVLSATNAHPRTAPLVKTLELAVDDLWHFMLVFGPCLMLFAAVGSWRFGSSNEDFASVMRSMTTLWDALLGPPDRMSIAATKDFWFAIYSFIYFLFVFFFFINFVLAIIVDAYTKVVDQLIDSPVEQSLIYDTCLTMVYGFHELLHGWPNIQAVVECVERMPGRVEFVTIEDILPAFPERARSSASLEKYKWFYNWDFLEPGYEGNLDSGQKELADIKSMLQRLLTVFENNERVSAASSKARDGTGTMGLAASTTSSAFSNGFISSSSLAPTNIVAPASPATDVPDASSPERLVLI